MKLVIAQGNPGDTFGYTRHNVGFLLADMLAEHKGTTFKEVNKFSAHIAEYIDNGEKVIIAKPNTFYNETGRSFVALKQFYKFDNADILLIHDELALPFGTIRSRVGGSDAGNNGIKSINSHGGDSTARLRIGIGNDQRAIMGDTDFVLGKFSKSEHAHLYASILPKSIEIIEQFVANTHHVTSHTLLDPSPESI